MITLSVSMLCAYAEGLPDVFMTVFIFCKLQHLGLHPGITTLGEKRLEAEVFTG